MCLSGILSVRHIKTVTPIFLCQQERVQPLRCGGVQDIHDRRNFESFVGPNIRDHNLDGTTLLKFRGRSRNGWIGVIVSLAIFAVISLNLPFMGSVSIGLEAYEYLIDLAGWNKTAGG